MKKLFMAIFTMVVSLLVVSNVNAADYWYTVEIDENEELTVTRTLSDGTVEDADISAQDPYIIDNGVITYNTELNKLTIKEGTVIDSIKSSVDLDIYTDDSEVFINYIELKNDSLLQIMDSKISFSDLPNSLLKSYSAENIYISNSELNIPKSSITSIEDLFIENSKIKAIVLTANEAVLKITDSEIETHSLYGGNIWGGTAQGMDWLEPDDYEFMGDNGRAYYAVLVNNSSVKLVGEGYGSVGSKRGILIKDSTIIDESTITNIPYVQYSLSASNSGSDTIGNTRSITIDNSEVSLKGYIKAGTHMNLVIKDSNVVTDASIGTSVFSPYPGGDLTITNSTVSSKATVLSNDETHSSSAIVADGNLTISNSKVIADASATNGAIVAIAYSGSLNYDNSAIIIDENGNELIKDIDISDIKYNKNFISAVKNIYTIGLKNSDGTLSGVDSDYAIIGNAYNVTVSISGGTWSDGTTEDKVIKILYGETLTEEDLPTGMKSTIGTTTGSWSESLPLTLTSDMKLVYTFDIENPNTVDSIFGCFAALIVSLVGIYVTINLRKKIIVK